MIREINGKEYTFQMTRKGIRAAEKAGMDMSEITTKPMSALGYMWYAALYANHPITFNKAIDLLDEYLDSEECSEDISELLNSLSEDYGKVFGLAAK